MFDKETDLGKIHFPVSVIERIIDDAVGACDGRVSLGNYKGKYMNALPGGNYNIDETEHGLEIVVYVVISFGAGISRYSKQILDYIYENVERVMGVRPHKVKIIVTGVQSKDNIAKRHIEIEE